MELLLSRKKCPGADNLQMAKKWSIFPKTHFWWVYYQTTNSEVVMWIKSLKRTTDLNFRPFQFRYRTV